MAEINTCTLTQCFSPYEFQTCNYRLQTFQRWITHILGRLQFWCVGINYFGSLNFGIFAYQNNNNTTNNNTVTNICNSLTQGCKIKGMWNIPFYRLSISEVSWTAIANCQYSRCTEDYLVCPSLYTYVWFIVSVLCTGLKNDLTTYSTVYIRTLAINLTSCIANPRLSLQLYYNVHLT